MCASHHCFCAFLGVLAVFSFSVGVNLSIAFGSVVAVSTAGSPIRADNVYALLTTNPIGDNTCALVLNQNNKVQAACFDQPPPHKFTLFDDKIVELK